MSHNFFSTARRASLLQLLVHLWQRRVACLRNGLRVLVLVGLAGSLAACDSAAGFMQMYAKAATDEERQAIVERNFIEPESRSPQEWSGVDMLGTTNLYMDFEEYRLLITDHESFMRYGVGLYLARNPEWTYERLRQDIGPDFDNYDIDKATFNYYRGWGQALLDEVKSRPENRYLVEREQLFLARLKLSEAGLIGFNPGKYVALLNDTERFTRFLKDDAFARSTAYPLRVFAQEIHIGPAYTGVTPGTGS